MGTPGLTEGRRPYRTHSTFRNIIVGLNERTAGGSREHPREAKVRISHHYMDVKADMGQSLSDWLPFISNMVLNISAYIVSHFSAPDVLNKQNLFPDVKFELENYNVTLLPRPRQN